MLVGNEEDLQKGLGIAGPEVTGKAASALDHSAFFGMIEHVVKRFPGIKVVATTLRHVHSTNRHSWSAVASINGEIHVAPTCELDVYDRVGGGDGFASGLFYGLLSGEPHAECVKLGWAHGAMITAFPGRHHHGHARAGTGVRQGRVGADSAMSRSSVKSQSQLPTPKEVTEASGEALGAGSDFHDCSKVPWELGVGARELTRSSHVASNRHRRALMAVATAHPSVQSNQPARAL